jgi:putative sterol carrier protein
MSLFKDSEELQKVFDAFMKEVLSHPLIGPKLAKSKMVVQFQYTDPDAQVTIDFREAPKDSQMPGHLIWGETNIKPDVVFKQAADFSNRFWQGKENVIAAMAKRQVSAKGSITKALQLIPVIRPSFRIYPQVLEKLGMKHLVIP